MINQTLNSLEKLFEITNNKIENFDLIEDEILSLCSLITQMDKECLMIDEIGEEGNVEDDAFNQMKEIMNDNDRLKHLKLNNQLNKETLSKLINLCLSSSNSGNNLDSLEVSLYKISPIKSFITTSKLDSLKIDFSLVDFTEENNEIFKKEMNKLFDELNNLSSLKLKFPTSYWCNSIDMSNMDCICLSSTLTSIEISGYFTNYHLLLEISKIKHLKIFKLDSIYLNGNDESNLKTESFLNYLEGKEKLINSLFYNFSTSPNLTRFAITNCGIEEIKFINCKVLIFLII